MSRIPLRLAALLLCGTALSACQTTGATDTAKAAAAPVTSASASNPNNNAASNLEAEIRRAQLLRTNGQYTEATQALSQMMLVAPDDARVVGEYGKVLAQQGRGQDAVAFLTRAVELNGNDYTLYSTLGVAHTQLNNFPAAEKAFQRALVLKPGDAATLNNFALSRMLAGDPVSAKSMLAQAQGADSSNDKIARNMALVDNLSPAAAAAAIVPAQPTKPVAKIISAAPVGTPLVANTAPAAPVAAAPAAAPRDLQKPVVVMQAVPKDPKAGPVATKKPVVAVNKPAAKPAATPAAATNGSGVTKKSVVPAIPRLRQTADASSQ